MGRSDKGLAAQYSPSMEDVDLREVLRKIWRRKGIIFATVVVLTTLTGIALFQMTKLYTAETLVMIETRGSNIVGIEAVLTGMSADAEAIESEIEVIRSRGLAEKTIKKLKLDQNPEFNETLRPKRFLADLLDLNQFVPKEWLDVLLGRTDEIVLSPEEIEAKKRVRIIDNFLTRLNIAPKGRSRVIGIGFTSENPETASKVANTLADLYIVEQLEVKFEATRRANEWLNSRISGLREKVDASGRAVEEFRRKSGLIESSGVTLAGQQLSELNTQMVLTRTKRAEAEARLRQVIGLVSSPGGVDSAAEVLQSGLIQRLREQEAEVQRKVAELAVEYGERHPKMINARAEVRDIEKKIQSEVNKIVKGLENEVGIAKAREASMVKSLEELKQEVGQSNRATVKLQALERESTADRTLLETFLSRFKETSAQEDVNIQQADARIISFADVPDKHSFPKRTLILALTFVGSFSIGLLLVFIVERLDNGFRSGEQIEKLTGVSVLGLVPVLSGLSKIGKAPESYILERPASAFGESIRTLHTSVLLSHLDEPPKSILITSSLPKEGKTTIASCLARMQAMAGRRTVIIDTDFRRPSVHRAFGIAEQPGLVELLAGEVQLEDVVQTDEASGAHVISSGTSAPNPSNILASDHMKRLLDSLAQTYDLIILDSPPVMAVSDARILSNMADVTVFVVRWAETRREVVNAGLKQIISSSGRLAGVVLSMVDVRKHARYGYSDSGVYYGSVKKYYTG